MARRVSGWDALRAWRFMRASKVYRDAWNRHRPQPDLPERAPFPVRLWGREWAEEEYYAGSWMQGRFKRRRRRARIILKQYRNMATEA